MANPYFKFKRFTVWHDKCAMKVNTDGALLGAWADTCGKRRILDVGTGTGLIALMIAQRSEAIIDAIDIDKDAYEQAKENISLSPFNGRIHAHHCMLSEYEVDDNIKYDLIVSNPPYFINSLKCPDNKRNLARHTDTLSIPDLLSDSKKLLAEDGSIALITPFDQREYIIDNAARLSLYPIKETHVSSLSGTAPKRLLMELSSRVVAGNTISNLTIEMVRGEFTDQFTSMMKEYYLNM